MTTQIILNHIDTKTYQDENVDPVIRKICDKMDCEQYSYTHNSNNISIKFGDTWASVRDDESGETVYLDAVNYPIVNNKSYDALRLSFNRVKAGLNEKKTIGNKITINRAIKNILEADITKPYVQRF